jgi:hypothetical protein
MNWKVTSAKKSEKEISSEKTDKIVQNGELLIQSRPVVDSSQKGLLALFRDFLLVGGDLV